MSRFPDKRVNFRNLNSQPPKEFIPEMREALMINEMGSVAHFLDGILPVSVQRWLGGQFPNNITFQRMVMLNDYRQENNIPVSRNPIC